MGDKDYPGIYICINNTYYNTLGNILKVPYTQIMY